MLGAGFPPLAGVVCGLALGAGSGSRSKKPVCRLWEPIWQLLEIVSRAGEPVPVTI